MNKMNKIIFPIIVVIIISIIGNFSHDIYVLKHVPLTSRQNRKIYMYTKKKEMVTIVEENEEKLNRVINNLKPLDKQISSYYLYRIESYLENPQTEEYQFTINNLEDLIYFRDTLHLDVIKRFSDEYYIIYQDDNSAQKEAHVELWLGCNFSLQDTNSMNVWSIGNENNNKKFAVKVYNFIYNR